jgi:hypothetical protein
MPASALAQRLVLDSTTSRRRETHRPGDGAYARSVASVVRQPSMRLTATVLADYQPQQDVRVYLDPAGHPFCLWARP